MPSLTATTVATNYLKNVRANGLGPRTLIVKIAGNAGILNVELNAAIDYITTSHGSAGTGDSAFVVSGLAGDAAGAAFVSGTSTDVFVAIQGTGDLTVASVKAAAEGATGGNATTFTVSIVAVFDQNYTG
jgi:hypothetical protein